ncbi:hypothetical protein I4U23_015623 [Adineta vaga]|nr:hypothetical protein I4U23_015623 [Adineta vaga]
MLFIPKIKYSLVEDPCDDCTVTLWCSPLALCQEARELKLRSANSTSAVILVQPLSIISQSQQVETTQPFSSMKPLES